MGSSCFARGNSKNLEFIEKLLATNENLDIDLIGSRCIKECSSGPNIIINGKMYNRVDLNLLKEILESHNIFEK